MLFSLKLTLYDPETSEIERELIQSFVPWKILTRASMVQKKVGNKKVEDYTEEDYNAIASLVIATFGDSRVTMDELNNKSDVGAMLAIVGSIVNRTNGNPTTPG